MARTDLNPITEDDIEVPAGLKWDIDLAGNDMSKATRRLYFEDSINQSGAFSLETVITPDNVDKNSSLKVSKEGIGAFYGVIKSPGRTSQGEDTLDGGGAAELLRDIPINGEFLSYNSSLFVTEVFDQLTNPGIRVGVNEELTPTSGSVDVRADDEGALKLLNRVVSSHGGEWYVSYDSQDDVFEFNVVNKIESSSVEKEFTENNTQKIVDEPVVDESYDGVIVKGYGDGENQVSGEYPDRASWPDDPRIMRYTDKTILSSEEANSTAENIYNRHTDWRSIYVYPSNMQELLNLGDKVSVNEGRSQVSGDFRVVSRTLDLDFKEKQQIEYVLSNKPLGIIDEAENVEEQTNSQTDYMQGSRNAWGEKEADNASNSEPLTIDFYLPDDVNDKKGKNRTNKVKMDYSLSGYKQSAGAVSSTDNTVTDAPGDNPDNQKVYSVSDTKSPNNTVEDLGATDVTLEKGDADSSNVGATLANNSHSVAGTTSDTERTGAAEVITNTLFTDSSFSDDIFANVWNNIALATGLESDYMYHRVFVDIFDVSNSTDITVAVSSDGEGSIGANSVYHMDTVASAGNPSFTHDIGGTDVETAYSTSFIVDGSAGDYDLEMYPQADTTIGWQIIVTGVEHTHDIGDNSNAVDLFDDQKSNRAAMAKYDGTASGTNFESSATSETKASRVESTSSNSEDTIDSTAQQKGARVSEVKDELAAGEKANDAAIIVDGTNIDGSGNTHGTDRDSEIDITSQLTQDSEGKPEVGWHTIKIRPEPSGEISYVKGRIFADHHKDA